MRIVPLIPLLALCLSGAAACDRDDAPEAAAPARPPQAPAPAVKGPPALALPEASAQPCPPGAAVCSLFDQVGNADISGVASVLVDGRFEPREGVVVEADFEGGMPPGWRLYDGRHWGVMAQLPEMEGQGEIVQAGGSAALKLTARKGDVGLGMCSAPVAVHGAQRFSLSYTVSGERLQAPGGDRYSAGSASALFYRLEPRGEGPPEVLLAHAGRARRAALKDKNLGAIPRHRGSFEGEAVTHTFSPPARATHMVLCLDLARPLAVGQGDKEVRGAVIFDDVRLAVVNTPLHRRGALMEAGLGAEHALKAPVRMRHRTAKVGSELRYALYAPAPTTLSYSVVLPEGAALRFGYGLDLPRPSPGAITFEVQVSRASGEAETVFSEEVQGRERPVWRDGEADLSAFAGEAVTLSLVTRGRPLPAGDDGSVGLFRLPEAGAFWGDPTVEQVSKPGRLMLLFAFDTLPASRTSPYRYRPEVSPNLLAFSQRATRFERALASSPWTLPSFASMLTGVTTARHRVGDYHPFNSFHRIPLSESFPTVALALRRAGWDTRAWINNPYLTAELGALHKGFGAYIDYGTRGTVHAAEGATDEIIAYLNTPSSRDRFVFVHLMDPHGPYLADADYRARFLSEGYDGPIPDEFVNAAYVKVLRQQIPMKEGDRARVGELYDAVVAYADDHFGRIIEAAEGAAAPDRLIVVTADHGEELWEHGFFEHGQSMYDELLRVPLLIREGDGAAQVVKAPVGAHQIAPTLLAHAGLPADGASLLAPPQPGPLFASSILYGPQRYAVSDGADKYIYTDLDAKRFHFRASKAPVRFELYDVAADAGEAHSRFAAERAVAQRLHQQLLSHMVQSSPGSFFIFIDSGGGPPLTVTTAITQGKGGTWSPQAVALHSPPDEGQGEAYHTAFKVPPGSPLMAADLTTQHGLFILRPIHWAGGAQLRLESQGPDEVPIPLSPQIGAGRVPWPASVDALIDDDALELSPQALVELIASSGAAGKPRVVLGRITPDGVMLDESSSAQGPSEGDRLLQEQLKSLGYLDE